jgi:peptidoglycan/LPS O-acetylase OafA/YrhL
MIGRARMPQDAKPHFDQIDALRCLAMSAVIAMHCHILPFGWAGVWLFYVISGLVVTMSLLAGDAAEPEASRAARLGGFYARRSARIWPIYLLFVAAGFLVTVLVRHEQPYPELLSFLFFYNNFQAAFAHGTFNVPALNGGHLWTISTEMQFYALYGVAFILLPRRTITRLLAACLVICPILRLAAGILFADAGFTASRAAYAIYAVSFLHFDAFAAGALIALSLAWARRHRRRLLLTGVAAFGTYCFVYVLVNVTVRGATHIAAFENTVSGILFGQFREVFLYSALALLFSGVVATALDGRAWTARILRARPLIAIGRVSYGGYVYHPIGVVAGGWIIGTLVHPEAGGLALKATAGVAQLVLALALTLPLAYASYRFIERPIIAATSRRLQRFRGTPRGAALDRKAQGAVALRAGRHE